PGGRSGANDRALEPARDRSRIERNDDDVFVLHLADASLERGGLGGTRRRSTPQALKEHDDDARFFLDRFLDRRGGGRRAGTVGGLRRREHALGKSRFEPSLEFHDRESIEVGGGDRHVVLESARHSTRVASVGMRRGRPAATWV